MSIINVILAVVLLSTSVFATLANISPSHIKRQAKIFIIVVILLITYVVHLLVFDDAPALFGYFLGLVATWPLFIAYFINKKAIEEPIGYSTLHWPMLVAAVVMILISILAMIPNTYTYPDMKPVIDSDFLVSRVGFLFMSVPGAIFYVLLAFNRTIIHNKGIFHEGLRWAWSDFEKYQWERNKRGKNEMGLILSTKSKWFKDQIRLKIDAEQKEFVESLLAKEIR